MGILTALVLASVALVNLLIGCCVYRRAPKSTTNRSFACLAATISTWAFAVAFSHYHPTSHLWNLRLAFLAASLIPLTLLNFVLSVQPSAACAPRPSRGAFLMLASFFCLASLTPLLGTALTRHETGFVAVYGPLHRPFTIYVVGGFLYSIGVLVVKLRRSAGLGRTQLKYLVLAFALSCALATMTNLLIPVFLNTSSFSKYGPLASLLLLGFVGHTIVRHRFMDIRIVAKRSAVYLVAAAGSCLILASLIFGANALLHDEHSPPYREIFVRNNRFDPLRPSRQSTGLDGYLYREPYSYLETIRRASAPSLNHWTRDVLRCSRRGQRYSSAMDQHQLAELPPPSSQDTQIPKRPSTRNGREISPRGHRVRPLGCED